MCNYKYRHMNPDAKNEINSQINNKWHSRWLNPNTKLNEIKNKNKINQTQNPELRREEDALINRL